MWSAPLLHCLNALGMDASAIVRAIGGSVCWLRPSAIERSPRLGAAVSRALGAADRMSANHPISRYLVCLTAMLEARDARLFATNRHAPGRARTSDLRFRLGDDVARGAHGATGATEATDATVLTTEVRRRGRGLRDSVYCLVSSALRCRQSRPRLDPRCPSDAGQGRSSSVPIARSGSEASREVRVRSAAASRCQP
jgi:hypothetical protein